VLTFLGTPDLSDEGNPISAIFDLGWFALVIANIIAIIVFSLFAHVAFDKYKTPCFTVKNFFEFYLMLFYNTKTIFETTFNEILSKITLFCIFL
jgi:hypothetical protein